MVKFKLEDNILMAQQIIEAEFNRDFMGCKAQLWWVPIYDQWEILLDVKYLYLSTENIIRIPRDLGRTYTGFIDMVYQIRKEIFKQFDVYFNALWC